MRSDILSAPPRGGNGLTCPDDYIDATAMCKAAGKLFADYARLVITRAVAVEAAKKLGLPVSALIVSRKGGEPEKQGTMLHQAMATDFQKWLARAPVLAGQHIAPTSKLVRTPGFARFPARLTAPIFYVFGCDDGFTKVGITSTPMQRLRNMESGSGRTCLEIAYLGPDRRSVLLERYVLEEFSRYRVRNTEWLRLPFSAVFEAKALAEWQG